jgi:hypothetical protein
LFGTLFPVFRILPILSRAFEQGARVNPECAMCFWCLYEADSFYHSTAQGPAGKALHQAAELKDHVSARERLFIDAAVAREKAMHDPNPRQLTPRSSNCCQEFWPNGLLQRFALPRFSFEE